MNVAYHCRACGVDWPGDWYDGPCCDKSDPVPMPASQASCEAILARLVAAQSEYDRIEAKQEEDFVPPDEVFAAYVELTAAWAAARGYFK